jgi:phosphoribosylformylglycinamidine (FGAM) synthase-like enzyme
MAEACRVLEFPVVSGNVSLYNETDGVGIPPTPVVGGIGLIENLDHVATLEGARAGDVLVLFGETTGNLGASAYARTVLGLDGAAAGSPSPVDLEAEKRRGGIVRHLIASGVVTAVHDVSDGGPLCAAAEMALAGNVGIGLCGDDLVATGASHAEILFGERHASYLLALPEANLGKLPTDEPYQIIGAVTASPILDFNSMEFWPEGSTRTIPLATLRAAHEGWLPAYMKGGNA